MNKENIRYYDKTTESGVAYFEDDTSTTFLSQYSRCCVCRRIPSELYCIGKGFGVYKHCPCCDMKDYKPKGFWRRFFWFINKRLGEW